MSKVSPPRPLCFVAMPFGKRSAPGDNSITIDFDRVWHALCAGIKRAGLDPQRADEDKSGGIIHRPMYESLLVAEYVAADLTFGNANVAYELGVRHGAGRTSTLIISSDRFASQLPFDFRPLRMVTYPIAADGAISKADLDALARAVEERLGLMQKGEMPDDNPIAQVTRISAEAPTDHRKIDVFLSRMRFVSNTTERIGDALAGKDPGRSVAVLDGIAEDLLHGRTVVSQLHTALLALFLGYREKKAYQRMIGLFPRLPDELQRTAVAREQFAFAYNRRAEGLAHGGGDVNEMRDLRARALRVIGQIPPAERTSETFGVLGRIYKGMYDAEVDKKSVAAMAALGKAIQHYEEGFARDPRDYYPGVNAVTLRILRADREDEARVAQLTPVVRFSVGRAPPPTPTKPHEEYWQAATRLEMASAERDWGAAKAALADAVSCRDAPWMEGWMFDTTKNNLQLQRRGRAHEPDTITRLDDIIASL